MKLPLPLTAILLSSAVCAAVPRGAVAGSGPQTGAASGAIAATGARTSAGAGARIPGAAVNGAPAKAGSATPASAHAARASQAAARVQARANEEKIAANARSGRLAKQQRAALLQGQRKTQVAAQTLARSKARLGPSGAAAAGVAAAGSTRAPAAGLDLSARGAHGVTATSQPAVRVTPTVTAAIIAASSRVAVASGTIGGPHRQMSGRLGGPAVGGTANHSAIDGSQLHRKF